MARKRYKAKSPSYAQARVRQLEKIVARLDSTVNKYRTEARQLAMLAADGPCFTNPLLNYEAKKIRDEILRIELHLNPDGTYINEVGG